MTHKVHMLWAHPRSVSTAFERVMRERGDLTVFHEPFMHFYYLERITRLSAEFEAIPGHPTTYPDTRNMILNAAETQPVFVKDMAYYMADKVLQDKDFMDHMTHVFLVRDPVETAVSYARIDPDFEEAELGFNAQWAMVQHLTARNVPVHVIRSDQLRRDPATTMQAYWEFAGLSPNPGALTWQQGTPKDWKYVEGWHKNVTASTGIKAAPDRDYKADFAALPDRFRTMVDGHLEAYQSLVALTEQT
ncbi:MAG: hypothetical protein AAF393_04625 [Pseudomonadota bacterium]